MGFLTRAFVPRSARRAMHPVRTAKSAATPRAIKQARSALNPIDSTIYAAERALNTKPRKSGKPRTLRALDAEPQPSSEELRRNHLAINLALLAVAVVYVILSLIFGWITVLVTTIALAAFIGWASKELRSI